MRQSFEICAKSLDKSVFQITIQRWIWKHIETTIKKIKEIFLLLRLTGTWEDRITLAKLKEKIVTEDGRIILRIENEEWKVPPEPLNFICSLLLHYSVSQM